MSNRNWTPEQRNAIEAQSGTVLVSAAAGSGKTSVLVERIVTHLTREKNPVAPDELLVVTFTNAAAAEMKARIYARLGEMIQENAENRRRLSQIRARLEEMQVSTMDAYCMRLVREYANVCGISPDFTILDNGEEKILQAQIVANVIEKLFSEDDEYFTALAKLFEAGSNDANLSRGITELSSFSMSEPNPAVWLDTVADHFTPCPAKESVWGRIITDYCLQTVDYCLVLCEKATREISYHEKLQLKYEEMFTLDKQYLAKLKNVCVEGDWDDIILAIHTCINDLKYLKFSADKGFSDDIHRNNAKDIRAVYKKYIGDLVKKIPATQEENDSDVAFLRGSATQLVKAVKLFNAMCLEEKKKRNAFSFSDISHFALDLLYDASAENCATPLAHELSAHYYEIMIDEYQDTNRAQDTLFNCLSKNGENMFMVGDVKQSIYRFRLASPEIFIKKCETYPYYDGIAKRSKIILSKNFRSRKGITQAVNAMFSSLMSKECGEITYNEDERLNYAADYPERNESDVKIIFIENKDDNPYQTEAQMAVKLIREELETGTVFDKKGQRKPTYSDFCILLRSVKGVAGFYADALRKAGIPVQLDNGEEFFEKTEIKLALALLRCADNPSKDVQLLAVLMSPLFGFTPDDVAILKIKAREYFGEKRYSLYNALVLCAEQGMENCRKVQDFITNWRFAASTLNAAEMVQKIFSDVSLISTVRCQKEGGIREANIGVLVQTAVRYSTDSLRGLSGFVRYMDALEQVNAAPGIGAVKTDENCVHIMTMHRSKGLEFPYVFIGGLTKEKRGGASSGLFVSHELGVGMKIREPENIKYYDTLSSIGVSQALENAELSEEMRIYYVAMTRAKERLYILMAPKGGEKKIDEITLALSDSAQIPAFVVAKNNLAWKWFVMAFSHHPNGNAFRGTQDYVYPFEGRVDIQKASPAELPEEQITAQSEIADEDLLNQFLSSMQYAYPFACVAGVSGKHTASHLNAEHFSSEFFAKSVPAFVTGQTLTPADIGTATHRYLEYCRFDEAEKNPENELQYLVKMGRLTQQAAACVDMNSIKAFFASSVYARIKKSPTVYREKEFTICKSICDLDASIDKRFSDEQTVIIGKTDLIFIQNETAVIVDYKTDRVHNIRELKNRYAEQMVMYREAVEKTLGLPVSECILYSLSLKEMLFI